MTNLQNIGLLILRLVGGGFMLTHGIPKLMKLMGGDKSFADPLGLGEGTSLVLTVFAEFICAIFLIFGFATRWVAIPLFVTMLVAAFIVHGSDPFGDKELALLYGGIYLAIAFLGSGRFGLDSVGKFD